MNRFALLSLALAIVSFLAGCGSDTTDDSTTSYDIPAPSTPSSKPLPDEYRTLAQQLSMEMKAAPKEFRDDKGIAEIMAEGHLGLLALRGIKSSDQDIIYIADQGQAAFSEALRRFERINALPKPPDAGALFVSSFIDGFFGNVYGGYARSVDAEDKQNAIMAEMHPLLAAIDKGAAAQQMLPMVAKKYSASFCDSTRRIVVDFDESWGLLGLHDWFCIYNLGHALEDCTILVQLTGASGEVKKNVHFVRSWPANSWLYGRYEGGNEVLERSVGRTTVTNVQKLDITIYSPKFATLIEYTYQGNEKDKDIAKRCEKLKFTGRYQPFVSGIIWDTERGAEFTLDGVSGIPKCRVDVTFRNGSKSKVWYWEYDYWLKGVKKSFNTPKAGLTFDPAQIDMKISFPGTSYKHEVTLTVEK